MLRSTTVCFLFGPGPNISISGNFIIFNAFNVHLYARPRSYKWILLRIQRKIFYVYCFIIGVDEIEYYFIYVSEWH